MGRVVLIACASKKKDKADKAKYLYQSSLFQGSWRYAESLKPQKIFILSARHGLLRPDEVISPYDESLSNKKAAALKIWADKVLKKLRYEVNLDEDEIIFLSGINYRKHLIPYIKNYNIPLEGLGIGKQLQFLKRANENNIDSLVMKNSYGE